MAVGARRVVDLAHVLVDGVEKGLLRQSPREVHNLNVQRARGPQRGRSVSEPSFDFYRLAATHAHPTGT